METKNKKQIALQKHFSSRKHRTNLFHRIPFQVLIVAFFLTGFPILGLADNNMHDSGVGGAGPGFGPASHEYELAVIKEIQTDGTLLLTDGRKIKIQESDLENPALRLGSEIVIFTKGGIYHLDREGRIVGSVIMLNTPYQIQNQRSDQLMDGDHTVDHSMTASHEFASKSTVAPPVGLFTKDTLRHTSFLMNTDAKISGLHVQSDGRVSGLISITEPEKQDSETN